MYIYDHVWRAIPSCWSRSLVAMLTVAVQEVRFSTADYQPAHSGVKKRSRALRLSSLGAGHVQYAVCTYTVTRTAMDLRPDPIFWSRCEVGSKRWGYCM
jgi:hypothetical protein